ncbi:substrate-binding periplasmic protein [Bdellovibrio bacteriovorus]|uniref:substrate-binding periplasmic protein n=1 Tax=Bdellovibrio TaxID=958 RepID=UPI0035A95FCE
MKFLVVTLILFSFQTAQAVLEIRVGAYDFPPYYEFHKSKHIGITTQTVKILNSLQKDYTFVIQRVPANRRYQTLERNRVDLYLYEDPAWEWSKYSYEFIPLDVEDGEVYITKAGALPAPQTFEELKKLRIAVVQGYHYGFAGLDADERALKKNFRIEILDNSKTCLHFVATGRADVTIVAKSFIYDFIRKNPDYRDKISISNNYDSIYKLGVVLSPKSRIPRAKMEALVDNLKKNAEFQENIRRRFEIK